MAIISIEVTDEARVSEFVDWLKNKLETNPIVGPDPIKIHVRR